MESLNNEIKESKYNLYYYVRGLKTKGINNNNNYNILSLSDLYNQNRNYRDSGFDIYHPNDIVIKPNESVIIDYKLHIVIYNELLYKNDTYKVIPRSSIYKTPIRLMNVYYFKSKYHFQVEFKNISNSNYEIKRGVRLLQIINKELETMKIIKIDDKFEFGDIIRYEQSICRYTLLIKPEKKYKEIYESNYNNIKELTEAVPIILPKTYVITNNDLGVCLDLHAVFIIYDNYKKETLPYTINVGRSSKLNLEEMENNIIRKLFISNYPPLIDIDYRGNLKLLVDNLGDSVKLYQNGIYFSISFANNNNLPVSYMIVEDFDEVDKNINVNDRQGGCGSTGV